MTTPSVIYEMLRSFVGLARTLNVSRTAGELGLTRQTVKRHIHHLQALKGKTLFDTDNRTYNLTLEGQSELTEAHALLDQLDMWLDERVETINGLATNHYVDDAIDHWNQRHRINQIWNLAPPLIQRGLECWCNGKAMIEHHNFCEIRPHIVVYRKNGADWICVEVGEKSSYSRWLGWTWAKSAVGSNFSSDPTNSKIDRFLLQAYESVTQNGSLWYDHVSTRMSRKKGGERVRVNYQRLVMSLRFPNGQSAVGVLVSRTNRISIAGLIQENALPVPTGNLMEIDV